MPARSHRRNAAAPLLLAAAAARAAYAKSGHASSSFVHLFEWPWDAVAQECEDWLGPHGFGAVQISPPTEHMQGPQWWTRYQPVTFKLQSRSGDEQAFDSMVSRCKAAGVDIYADAVLNQFAGGSGTGTAGTQYGRRSYGSLFSPPDFHHTSGDDQSNCLVSDYKDKYNVQNCDLLGLPDICTGCSSTQDKLAGYMNTLAAKGVAGFRMDAAKHQDAGEMGGYMNRVNAYKFTEVIGASGEAVTPSMYTSLGDVTEFQFAFSIADNIRDNGNLKYFKTFGESWGLMSSATAVTFIDNHDTQRGNAPFTYKDGSLYQLANIFMLATPYGYPKVMSSYYFTDFDRGPPSTAPSKSTCGDGSNWVCEHRWPAIAGMAGWRRSAGAGAVSTWQDGDTGGRIAFGRGGAAFLAMNREEGAWSATLDTGLPPGSYCDVILPGCVAVTVDASGAASVRVPGVSAVALHAGAMAGPPPPPAPTPPPPAPTPAPPPTPEPAVPPIPAPATCDVANASRVDCTGHGGSQDECEQSGCCWSPAGSGSVQPWCYVRHIPATPATPTPPGEPTCELADTAKVDCHYGEADCVNSGCCWSPAGHGSVTPWCYYKAKPPAPLHHHGDDV